MRQTFAISSSAFGRGKKNQCVISVVQKQNLLTATTTQHPPFTKPDGSVSAQHELSRSRCSDPTGTQMLSRRRKKFWMWGRRRTGIHNFRWTGDRVKDGSWDAAGSISGLMAGVLMGPIRQLGVRITTPTDEWVRSSSSSRSRFYSLRNKC